MNVDDVRVLLELVVYLDLVQHRDGVITAESWAKQCGEVERAALQRLADALGL